MRQRLLNQKAGRQWNLTKDKSSTAFLVGKGRDVVKTDLKQSGSLQINQPVSTGAHAV